jgi:hypothetical protein
MTDRYKGFLVTLDHDTREDDAESIITALQMVKGIHSVKPYISTLEDRMCQERATLDTYAEIIQAIFDKRKERLG